MKQATEPDPFLTPFLQQSKSFDKQKETSSYVKVDYEKELKTNMDSLLFKLVPDGPSRKTANEYRFGRHGSIVVSSTGDGKGSFYDHENKEGGGLLKLIGKENGLDWKESRDWAKGFLGIADSISVPKEFTASKGEGKKIEGEWISQIPASGNTPQNSYKFNDGREEVARYTYKDADGKALFYTLRMEDKDGMKAILPLSYGSIKGKNQDPSWAFKRPSMDKLSLYNLDQLKKHPDAKVLIVEGEKAADAVSKKFPEGKYVGLSWIGGSSSVNKSDWSPLHGRNVVVWPDNDKVGFKAGEQACSELRKAGVGSLKMVGAGNLQKNFPEKWDVADSLPKGMSESQLKDLTILANEKSVGVDRLIGTLKVLHKDINFDDPKNRALANEVLWKTEERQRHTLEKEFGNNQMKVREEITKSVTSTFNDKSLLEKHLTKDVMEKAQQFAAFKQQQIQLDKGKEGLEIDR